MAVLGTVLCMLREPLERLLFGFLHVPDEATWAALGMLWGSVWTLRREYMGKKHMTSRGFSKLLDFEWNSQAEGAGSRAKLVFFGFKG